MIKDSEEYGFYFKSKDGKDIFLYCWDKVSEPKGIVQIFHGMAEHAGRYGRFAEYLNKAGFIVYANDHRGHGRTAGSLDKVGCIGEDGFNKIVDDEHTVMELIRKRHSDLPVIVFGHSFGSFVAHEYLIRYGNDVKGAILCGSAAKTGVDVTLGRAVAYLEKSFFGDDKKSRLINTLCFAGYNKRIEGKASKAAWICSNPEEVRKYDEDPFCGTVFTAGFYYYFFKGLSRLYARERLAMIPSRLPLLLIAGEEDPVGSYGRSVRKLFNILKASGMEDVSIKLYKGMRHELINEINKQSVFDDISVWIAKVIN